jgi:transcriptional regulator with XRE-family HTH domain
MEGKDLRAILSSNIRLYRHNHGWSQADLAEKADISITFLSSIERCTKWPYPDTLVKLAKALKIKEFELFRYNGIVTDETATLIDRLVVDISVSVKESIEKTYQRYRCTELPSNKKGPPPA